MKHLKPIITCLILLVSFIARGQKDFSKYAVGVNFVPLYSGTPELQLDYFPTKYFGFSASGGYTYKALRGGFVKVGDYSKIDDLKGSYFKIGLKYRTPSKPRKHIFIAFAQLSYIYSYFNETGRRYFEEGQKNIRITGFANAFAAAFGFECRLLNHVFLRGGLQYAISFRNEHLGYPGHTFQPGIGASGLLFNNQIALGLVFKFSDLKCKSD
ncbi:hypothetical protein [Aurantibacillus circumpalustris]|uniref:hypothetical protein n=1 Tax=Aurantibacillus circumpalustris TaxID=3036359 RepID=UPI00295AE6D5|nr:hypothetical protein [Aurantibacillus circumpalustris]